MVKLSNLLVDRWRVVQVKSADIHPVLSRLKGYSGTYIKEFTWWTETYTLNPERNKGLRIDGLLLDVIKREVHGFEVKVDLWDWHRDKKWQSYKQFCTTLSVACPEGMIDETEVPPGFGLLWINDNGTDSWVRKPKRLNHDPATWSQTYLRILESEFPRMQAEIRRLRAGKYKIKPTLQS